MRTSNSWQYANANLFNWNFIRESMRQFKPKNVKTIGPGPQWKFISNQQYIFDRNSHSKQSQIHSTIEIRFSGIVRFQWAIAHCSSLIAQAHDATCLRLRQQLLAKFAKMILSIQLVVTQWMQRKKKTKQIGQPEAGVAFGCRRQCRKMSQFLKRHQSLWSVGLSRLVCVYLSVHNNGSRIHAPCPGPCTFAIPWIVSFFDFRAITFLAPRLCIHKHNLSSAREYHKNES